MDKKQAKDLIQGLFSRPFDLDTYQHFLRNLLNHYEERDKHYAGNLITEVFRSHINQYWRIGKYVDPDGNELDLLVVEVKSFSKLERARTALRNFAVNRLKQFEKEASLVAFYAKDDNGADWRFSFVKIEHEAYQDEKGKVKLKQDLTPARRYSYLVGEHENSHTACKQLLPVLSMDYADPRIEEIEAVFSIEKITEEFFDQYKALFQKLAKHLKKQSWFKQGSDEETDKVVSRFAKKLLGQIVFLYFLQKKGWLGASKGKNWGEGSKRFLRQCYDQATKPGGNYYRDFLQYLFYEALACERKGQDDPGYYQRFDCRIPFLNGGLFEADYDDWETVNVDIPNSLFHNVEKTKAGDTGTGILDVFDRYNFTIKEDEPLDKEVAVDPEMLGKVFENMLEGTERKSKGAFYTPREIVHYMCQESLIHYLDNRLNSYVTSYEELGSPQTSLFANTATKGQLKLTAEQQDIKVPKGGIETLIRKGHLALENDTRVLSKGKETETYRFQLPESVRNHAREIDTALADIKVCDPAIGSGAFPVGLLHEIVNARLALAPHSGNGKSAYDLKRHAIAESIYGVDIDASAIDIARLRLWLSLIVDEEDYDTIEALPNLDYKIVQGDSLIGFPENWQSPAFEQLEALKKDFFAETDHDKKAALKAKIDIEIQKRLANSRQVFGYQVDFDFRLMFSEVWHHKNGFDVVIGNPPYLIVYDKESKKAYEKLFACFKRNNDLYVAFIQKSLSLLNNFGDLAFITPNTFLNGDYFKVLRRWITKNSSIKEIIDFKNSRVFEDPTVFVAISHFTFAPKLDNFFVYKLVGDSFSELQSHDVIYSKDSDDPFVPTDPVWSLLKKRMEADFDNLFLIKDVGFNYWTEGGGKNRKGNSIGKRVFLKGEKNNPLDIPYLKGKEINKYSIDEPKNYLRYNYEDFLDPEVDTFRFSEEILRTSPKICYRQTASKIIAALDYKSRLCDKTIHVIINRKNSEIDLRYVLALSNSQLFEHLYMVISQEESGRAFSQVKTTYVKKMPFVSCADDRIILIVDYLQRIAGESNQLQSAFYKQLIDGLVYELYFPDELKSAGKDVLRHLGELTPITDEMSDEEKLAIIQREFDRLYDPRHPVRNIIETLDSVEVVRTIREALKQ